MAETVVQFFPRRIKTVTYLQLGRVDNLLVQHGKLLRLVLPLLKVSSLIPQLPHLIFLLVNMVSRVAPVQVRYDTDHEIQFNTTTVWYAPQQ